MATDRLFIRRADGGKIEIPARVLGVEDDTGWSWARSPVVNLSALPVLAQMREIRRLARLPGRQQITVAASRAGFVLAKIPHAELFVWGVDMVLTPHLSDRFMVLRGKAKLRRHVRLTAAAIFTVMAEGMPVSHAFDRHPGHYVTTGESA